MVLSGALAQKPSNAGHSWVFLNWLLGFRRLGWEVLFLDSLTPEMSDGPIGQSENLAYLVSTMASFGMGDDWSLFDRSDGCLIAGLTRAEVLSIWTSIRDSGRCGASEVFTTRLPATTRL